MSSFLMFSDWPVKPWELGLGTLVDFVQELGLGTWVAFARGSGWPAKPWDLVSVIWVGPARHSGSPMDLPGLAVGNRGSPVRRSGSRWAIRPP